MEELRKKGLWLEDLTTSELQITGGAEGGFDFWQLVDTAKKVLYFLDEYASYILEGFKQGWERLHPTFTTTNA
jgi:hypothetical protein